MEANVLLDREDNVFYARFVEHSVLRIARLAESFLQKSDVLNAGLPFWSALRGTLSIPFK